MEIKKQFWPPSCTTAAHNWTPLNANKSITQLNKFYLHIRNFTWTWICNFACSQWTNGINCTRNMSGQCSRNYNSILSSAQGFSFNFLFSVIRLRKEKNTFDHFFSFILWNWFKLTHQWVANEFNFFSMFKSLKSKAHKNRIECRLEMRACC